MILQFTETKAQSYKHIKVDELQREYIIYLPKNLPKNAPLVFVFHGYTDNAKNVMTYFGMNEIADKNGFAVCYPQGWKDKRGDNFWQVGYYIHKEEQVNDIKFISVLTSYLQKKYHLNKERTYISGISNGGDFCNLLICKSSGQFKAAAPLISCIMKDMYDSCINLKPFPVLLLNGMEDKTTYWAGDMKNEQGYGPYLPTQAMVEFYIAKNNSMLTKTDTVVGDLTIKDDYTVRSFYINQSNDKPVWVYTVKNGGHAMPKYLNIASEVWRFFSLY
jgi:polyhydroxybutyrate depolymerase